MGIIFPLSVFLAAAGWVTASMGIVISWFLSTDRKLGVWRTCLYLSIVFAIMPAFLAIAALVDSLQGSYSPLRPVILLVCAVSAPVFNTFMYYRKGDIKHELGKL